MNLLETTITTLFPGWAAHRAAARSKVRAYEAAKPSRLHKKRFDRGSGDTTVLSAGDALRIQARHLDENHDLAHGVLNTLVNNVIGSGIRVEPQIKAKNGALLTKLNSELLQLFEDWMLKPEVTWELHWNQLQRIAARSLYRDGEVLAQLIPHKKSNLDHGTRIPYSIELIEADLLPLEFNDAARNIIQGVEKNIWGRPRAYHLYKQHPGDHYGTLPDSTHRISADNIVHLKCADRIRQTRGVSAFATIIQRLDDIKEYEESERVAARVAAAMCAFIRKPNDIPANMADYDAQGNRMMSLKPGMIFDQLLPGEDIVMIEANRPSSMLEHFRNAQLKAIAAGSCTSYSSIAKDYNGTYSAQRQELVEQSVHYAVLREHFVERFIRPIWKCFVEVAFDSHLIKPPVGMNIFTRFDADFRGPSIPWIDPLKEIKAEEKAVQAGFKSRSQVIRERGSNPNTVNEQIKSERQNEHANKLMFTSNYSTFKKP